MGEEGLTSNFRVQSIAFYKVLGLVSSVYQAQLLSKRRHCFLFFARPLFRCRGKASPRKVTVASQLHIGWHPAPERVWSLSELLMCCVAPTQGRAFGEELQSGGLKATDRRRLDWSAFIK